MSITKKECLRRTVAQWEWIRDHLDELKDLSVSRMKAAAIKALGWREWSISRIGVRFGDIPLGGESGITTCFLCKWFVRQPNRDQCTGCPLQPTGRGQGWCSTVGCNQGSEPFSMFHVRMKQGDIEGAKKECNRLIAKVKEAQK